MLSILTKKQWQVSHILIIFGLVSLSLGIWLNYNPQFPAWIPLVGGLWAVFGGLCHVFASYFKQTKKK